MFSSPHSGRMFCTEFTAQSQLNIQTLRSSEDAFVDALIASAPRHGAPLLCALNPRSYVDLNRAPDELDPALIQDMLETPFITARSRSGLGVIPRVVAGGRAIYRGKISHAEAQHRIENTWHPYHNKLKELLSETKMNFGQAILIDCHSMPQNALQAHTSINGERPDIVIGDRHGKSAAPAVTQAVERALTQAGFRVARNFPFAGAYIAQHYGRPQAKLHVVQIEINRALYMDETRIQMLREFSDIRDQLDRAILEICRFGMRDVAQELAAE